MLVKGGQTSVDEKWAAVSCNITASCVDKKLRHLRLIFCTHWPFSPTVYPKKSFIMISHEVFIHIHQGCFAGTGAIVRLPQCQWSKPDGYGKISQCITTTKHSKAKTVCIFLGIYCIYSSYIMMTSGNISRKFCKAAGKYISHAVEES